MSKLQDRDEVFERLILDGNKVQIRTNGQAITRMLRELPPEFVNWQLQHKLETYDSIDRNEYVAFSSGHLPVVGTLNPVSNTPNLACKGIGFTPKDEYLGHYLRLLEETVDEIRKYPPEAIDETRSRRVAAARYFYSHPEHIDWRRIALLEIFEGNTYRNLRNDPHASVLWTGTSPMFTSFQADCVVEILSATDPRYRFAWAMRRLFEYEPFHVLQTTFPFAYCFWIIDWKDKTPRSRNQEGE